VLSGPRRIVGSTSNHNRSNHGRTEDTPTHSSRPQGATKEGPSEPRRGLGQSSTPGHRRCYPGLHLSARAFWALVDRARRARRTDRGWAAPLDQPPGALHVRTVPGRAHARGRYKAPRASRPETPPVARAPAHSQESPSPLLRELGPRHAEHSRPGAIATPSLVRTSPSPAPHRAPVTARCIEPLRPLHAPRFRHH
jgi:hypothetical protein